MTAPVRHSIKLYTMRELHLFFVEDTLELPLPLQIPPMLAVVRLLAIIQKVVVAYVGSCSEVLEFYHILGSHDPAKCRQESQVGPSGASKLVRARSRLGVRHLRKLTGGRVRDPRQGLGVVAWLCPGDWAHVRLLCIAVKYLNTAPY